MNCLLSLKYSFFFCMGKINGFIVNIWKIQEAAESSEGKTALRVRVRRSLTWQFLLANLTNSFHQSFLSQKTKRKISGQIFVIDNHLGYFGNCPLVQLPTVELVLWLLLSIGVWQGRPDPLLILNIGPISAKKNKYQIKQELISPQWKQSES